MACVLYLFLVCLVELLRKSSAPTIVLLWKEARRVHAQELHFVAVTGIFDIN